MTVAELSLYFKAISGMERVASMNKTGPQVCSQGIGFLREIISHADTDFFRKDIACGTILLSGRIRLGNPGDELMAYLSQGGLLRAARCGKSFQYAARVAAII